MTILFMREIVFRFEESENREPKILIIPMVDVMLFLIAFYVLITGSILPGMNVKTNPPETSKSEKIHLKKKVITVSIKADGTVYFGNKKIPLSLLKEMLKSEKEKNPSLTVAINSDRDASVQMLVSVMDAVEGAGIKSIGLITKVKR